MGSIPLCVWEWSSLEIWKGAQIVLGSMQLQPHRFFKKKKTCFTIHYTLSLSTEPMQFQLLNARNQPKTCTYIKFNILEIPKSGNELTQKGAVIFQSNFFPLIAWQTPSGPKPPRCRDFTITLRNATLGRILWMSDQPDAETSTWQHTTLTRERQGET